MGDFDRYIEEERDARRSREHEEREARDAAYVHARELATLKQEAVERATRLRPEVREALMALAAVRPPDIFRGERAPSNWYFSRADGGWTLSIEPVFDEVWTRRRLQFRGWRGYLDVKPRPPATGGPRVRFRIAAAGNLSFTLERRDETFTLDSAVDYGMLSWPAQGDIYTPSSGDSEMRFDLSQVLDDLLRLLAGYLVQLGSAP